MPYPNVDQLPENIKGKLTPEQQEVFRAAFNSASAEGKSESECFRAGWTAAIVIESRIVHHAFLFRPGNWDAAEGDGKISEKMVEDAVFAMNRCEEMGVPIALKYLHSEDAVSIPVGIVKNVTLEDGHMAYGDGYVLQDARADMDGEGSKILVTIDQMADALLTDGMKLSVEAFYNVKIPSYYGDKVISLEPSAMAILPAGVAPAVPEKMAAGRRGGKPVVFLASKDTQEGGKQMELEALTKLVEELVKRIDALEKVEVEPVEAEKAPDIAELEKINADLQAKLDAAETEKLTAEVTDLTAEVKEKMLPGQAEKLDVELGKTTSLSEKKVVLSRLNAIITSPADIERKLRAGRETKIDKSRSIDKAILERMEATGEGRLAASRYVRKTLSESELDI